MMATAELTHLRSQNESVRPVFHATLLRTHIQRLLPTVISIVVGYAVLDQMFWFLFWREMNDFRSAAILFHSLSPLVLAAGAVSQLLVSERDSRAWNWLSTLPVHWFTSFASYLTAALTMSLAGYLSCFLLFQTYLAFSIHYSAGSELPNTTILVSTWPTQLVHGIAITINTVLFLSIAALIISESVTALVVGIFCTCLFMYPLSTQFSESLWTYVGIESLLLVVAFSILGCLHHWRWYRGQNFSLADWIRGSIDARPAFLIESPVWFLQGQVQSPFLALYKNSHSIGLGLRIVAVLWFATLFYLQHPLNDFGKMTNITFYVFLPGFVPAILFGVSVFAIDNKGLRYRFFADRGIRPANFYWGRLLPPWLMLMGCTLICLTTFPRLQIQWSCINIFLALTAVFLISSLTAICTSKAIFAILMSFIAVSIGFFHLAISVTPFFLNVRDEDLWLVLAPMYVSLFVFCAVILVLSIRWFVPTWFVLDRPTPRLFAGLVLVLASYFLIAPLSHAVINLMVPDYLISDITVKPLDTFGPPENSVPLEIQSPPFRDLDTLENSSELVKWLELYQKQKRMGAKLRVPDSVGKQLESACRLISEQAIAPEPVSRAVVLIDATLTWASDTHDIDLRLLGTQALAQFCRSREVKKIVDALKPRENWQLQCDIFSMISSHGLRNIKSLLPKDEFEAIFPVTMTAESVKSLYSNIQLRQQQLALGQDDAVSNSDMQEFELTRYSVNLHPILRALLQPTFGIQRKLESRRIARERVEAIAVFDQILASIELDVPTTNILIDKLVTPSRPSIVQTQLLSEYARYRLLRKHAIARLSLPVRSPPAQWTNPTELAPVDRTSIGVGNADGI